MATVNFKLGENLGNILLEIAQENIVNGTPERAFETYTRSFNGMDVSYALRILKNKFVVETCEDGININLTDDKEAIKNNASNIYDWKYIINKKDDELGELLKAIYNVKNEFDKHCRWASINDVNLTEVVESYFGKNYAEEGVGVHNLAAHWIACGHLGEGLGNGANIWQGLVGNVESDTAEHYEYTLYYIVKYVELIKYLHKAYINFEKTYRWLYKYKFISRIYFVENRVEHILEELYKFADQNTGYYHPMCDEEISKYKNLLMDDICKSTWGNEYAKFGILKKNITDGYDAGYLSPEGDFYGQVGDTSSMIHLNLAEQLFDKKLNNEMTNDGVVIWGSKTPENWLDENGWIKIHHNEVYGSFIGDKKPTKNFKYKYAPTDVQIREICSYIDTNWNGKLYTQPQIVKRTYPISTYKLRQMDEIQLHELFGI